METAQKKRLEKSPGVYLKPPRKRQPRKCFHNLFSNGYEKDHSPKSVVFGPFTPLIAARRIKNPAEEAVFTGLGAYENSF